MAILHTALALAPDAPFTSIERAFARMAHAGLLPWAAGGRAAPGAWPLPVSRGATDAPTQQSPNNLP
jgi:hypothetical protein